MNTSPKTCLLIKTVLVKYFADAKCEISAVVLVKFSAHAESEMK